ncbi:Holliday junction branch migration DNA helicase RuvB [Methylacidiphilum kamchatkense]|uniref:Holliday junction branch migration complex subunit RuvB n=1 Tax=Methylacidiphilum kamchatkense Kam1 TaxID=1202785 RepID=A0A516TKF4_9BACT|nr:Holliday junction branch migration DNA helicase RuvB [Methylacidiphilum kamchatkense]QDQ41731.1 Holliday junction DNA helicase subunit RuvB [Methylacidiphilum kamchatkense Kam1]
MNPKIKDVLAQPTDSLFEENLRPQKLDDFLGQEKIKERLYILVQAAKIKKEPLPHLLFSGPPGLGKTTLAHILSKEMNASLKITSGPALDKAANLAGILTTLESFDFLFIDEIHRLSRPVEEYLYPAMEDFRMDILIDQGPNARSIRLNLPKFTLVGATTRVGLLTEPLRSRFGLINRLEYYKLEELVKIVQRSSRILEMEINEVAAREVAKRCRGTPRTVNHLLKWIRDYAYAKGHQKISLNVVNDALAMIEIDEDGLDEMDKKILETIVYKFEGGPVGLQSLAVAVGEDPGTLEEVHEPYLIMEGYIKRTPQGRVVTTRAYEKLKVAPPSAQVELF